MNELTGAVIIVLLLLIVLIIFIVYQYISVPARLELPRYVYNGVKV